MEIPDIDAKLKALRSFVSSYIDSSKPVSVQRNTAYDLVNRYNTISRELKTKSALFEDLPDRYYPPVRSDNRDLVASGELTDLVRAIDYCINLIASSTIVEIPAMKVTREGIYFAGQYFDAFQQVSQIFSEAGQSIAIIDGYVDERVLNLLTKKKTAVEVRVLTKNVSPALTTAAITFNKQYGQQGRLLLRTSSAFHDRFVIIDDKDFFHFGASIKDLGNRGFMFSLIEEAEVKNALLAKLSQEWATATVAV